VQLLSSGNSRAAGSIVENAANFIFFIQTPQKLMPMRKAMAGLSYCPVSSRIARMLRNDVGRATRLGKRSSMPSDNHLRPAG